MPKGRGSNKRRGRYQKDNRESVERGAIKLAALYEMWIRRVNRRRKDRP